MIKTFCDHCRKQAKTNEFSISISVDPIPENLEILPEGIEWTDTSGVEANYETEIDLCVPCMRQLLEYFSLHYSTVEGE